MGNCCSPTRSQKKVWNIFSICQVVSIDLIWVFFMPFLYNGIYYQPNWVPSPPPHPIFHIMSAQTMLFYAQIQCSCVSHTHTPLFEKAKFERKSSQWRLLVKCKFFFLTEQLHSSLFLLCKFWSCQQVRFSNISIFLRIVFNFNHTPISTNSLGSPFHQILYCGLSNWHFQAQF